MVTCMMAKNYGVKHTVARIRNTEYALTAKDLLNQGMNIDLILNPERITATEINHILMTPSALDVDDFAEGKVRMFEARMSDASPYVGVPLKDLEIPKQILIAMLFRRHKMIIPHGDDMLEPGDNVYFVGQQSVLRNLRKLSLILRKNRTGYDHRCWTHRQIFGSYAGEQGLFVKVIEKNKDRCQLIAQKLENGIVLCGEAQILIY